MSNYVTAKQNWHDLVNAHERTSQVRKFQIALLYAECEVFKMKKNESFHKLITRLTSLVIELLSMGKVLTTE